MCFEESRVWKRVKQLSEALFSLSHVTHLTQGSSFRAVEAHAGKVAVFGFERGQQS